MQDNCVKHKPTLSSLTFYMPNLCVSTTAVAPATHTNIVLYILTDWPDDIDKRMEIYNKVGNVILLTNINQVPGM